MDTRPTFKALRSRSRLGGLGQLLTRGIQAVVAALAVTWMLSASVTADVVTPTTTTVYFTHHGQPYRHPVNFTVQCYGYQWEVGPPVTQEPGSYVPYPVFSFSAACPSYGCKIQEPFYLNYRHIDYCDLLGETQGQQFTISQYATSPLEFGNCTDHGGVRTCELRFAIPDSIVSTAMPEDAPQSVFDSVFLRALLVTLLVEVTTLVILTRWVLRLKDISTGQAVFAGVIASALTLPFLWFVLPGLLPGGWLVPVGEALVWLVEAAILKVMLRVSLVQALLLSLIANALSFGAGLLLF